MEIDEREDWVGDLRDVIGGNEEEMESETVSPSSSQKVVIPVISPAAHRITLKCSSRWSNKQLCDLGLGWMKSSRNSILCAVSNCHVQAQMKKTNGSYYRLYKMNSAIRRTKWCQSLKLADPTFVTPFGANYNQVKGSFQLWVCERHFSEWDLDQMPHKMRPRLLIGTNDYDPNYDDFYAESQRSLMCVKSGGHKCVVKECPVSNNLGAVKSDGSEFTLYKVPSHPLCRTVWLRAVSRRDSSWRPTHSAQYICERHFEGNEDPMPTLKLFPRSAISKAESMRDMENIWCCFNVVPMMKTLERLGERVETMEEMINVYHDIIREEYDEEIEQCPAQFVHDLHAIMQREFGRDWDKFDTMSDLGGCLSQVADVVKSVRNTVETMDDNSTPPDSNSDSGFRHD